MTQHKSHQMKLTSLLVKWGSWNEAQFNDKFRQDTERKILLFHKEHPKGLTDEDLINLFGNPDSNVVRPRRCDLSTGTKRRPAILYDSGEKRKNKHNNFIIVWKLNPDNLIMYLEG